MERILKKYTTIPQHLYVNRSADEQLAQIVNEMQRPGYVLVARQMGKTNLLFNAKRTLENKNRLFVYVDLSNVFIYELDCYRNIIDSIIEPNEELFESIESIITEIRTKNLPPHKEYSRSLRTILDFFGGDIVIVLDEIDALRSAEYSDNIFAQIRSNYFSRTNFPVFEKLTYILSGVIEPTELIKDRNKSPFNIGDKIYLNDFTFDEHMSFIVKSKLDLSDDISEEIYNWTNGNPRLTFDICSKIESIIIEENSINFSRIELLIKEKYLTSYDIAPIDHIRELVKSNKKVRNAVYNIQKGNNDINDEIKQQLYLYGIISSDFNSTIKIKNKIIEKSLTIDWINSINQQSQDDFSYGLDKFINREFKEAIEILKNFLLNGKPSEKQIEICNYNIGFSYYSLKDIDNAVKYFSHSYQEEPYCYNSKSFLGVCKLGQGQKERGIEILKEFILDKRDNYPYHFALLNLGVSQLRDNPNYALELFKELYDSTFKSNEYKEGDVDQLRTLAQYYQAEIYFNKDEITDTLLRLKDARKYSNESDSLYLIFSEYNITSEKKPKLLIDLVNTIIDNKLTFDDYNVYPVSFKKNNLNEYLNLVFDKDDLTLFNKLIDYSREYIYKNTINNTYILYEISGVNSSKQKDILTHILSHYEDLDNKLLLNLYRDLTYLNINEEENSLDYFTKYLNLFEIEKSIILSRDIYIFAVNIKLLSDKKSITEAINLCKVINIKISLLNDQDELIFESLIIYYWFSSLYFSIKAYDKSTFYANKTLDIINNSKSDRTSIIDEKGVSSISKQMNQIKNSINTNKPIIKGKKYGRNEKVKVKYNNGDKSEGKYKKFEADILAERCVII